jgi:predicted metal-dependent peptidase
MIFPTCDFQERDKLLTALFCIDVSGSIEMITAQRFLGIAKKHDKENDFEVKVITFSMQVRELNLRKDEDFYVGGGTSFQNLVHYINSNHIKYDVVFVLTDGDGGYVDEKIVNSSRWFWLITPGGREVSKSYGESHYIPEEYMKNVVV